jgi:hypothetical protein
MSLGGGILPVVNRPGFPRRLHFFLRGWVYGKSQQIFTKERKD